MDAKIAELFSILQWGIEKEKSKVEGILVAVYQS